MLNFVATNRYKIIFLCFTFIEFIVMIKKESALVVPNEIVMSKIYIIRNHKVMLDRDLAELYGVKSIRLREQVKRNITKFPEHFMFQLTEI